MRVTLRGKVLVGFGLLACSVIGALSYGAWTLRALEGRMETVNDLYVPALKALNQVENSFYLLESDLDKSIEEGIVRPKETLESVLDSRLDYLKKLASKRGNTSPQLERQMAELASAYLALSGVLNRLYANWDARADWAAELSAKRADFRLKLRSLIQNIDHEMRAVSALVQGGLRNQRDVLIGALAFCCLLAAALFSWLAWSMAPLQGLSDVMRSISISGLNEAAVRKLSEVPTARDEIGTLAMESRKMAATLLDQSKALQDQKQFLQKAHRDLAKQNEELRSTQAKLLHSEKLGLVGRMAAQMAHEIRNPLNALGLHAELLEDQLRGDSRALGSLGLLQKEITRLIAVTESYLDLSRAPRLQKERVQVNDLVEELQNLYEPLLKERGIFLTCDLGLLPAIPADRSQLTQVLGNLLKNAAEAFGGGPRTGGRYIRMITQYGAGFVSVTVMDNGDGIPADQQKHIFSPFFTGKAQGNGLGLTFSRQVVEAHGGDINFDSAARQGTKFTIRLPVGEERGAEEGMWKGAELKS